MCGKVVEHQPGGGDHAQIVDGAGVAGHEVRGAELVFQGDEAEESAGDILGLAQTHEVVNALLVRLNVAVEHGGVGMQSHAVGQVVNLDPAVGPGLAAEELASHPLGGRPPPRHRAWS